MQLIILMLTCFVKFTKCNTLSICLVLSIQYSHYIALMIDYINKKKMTFNKLFNINFQPNVILGA